MVKGQSRNKFFYGWIILIIAALGQFFSGPGQTYSVSIFINSYIEQFSWSHSMVSGFYSFATLCAGFILPRIGRKIDDKGHKKMIPTIASLLGLTCLWMSFVNQPIMLFVGFLFLRLFGQGSMTLLSSTLVPKWFVKRRGLAVSLMGLGGVLGSAIFPPVNNWLINSISPQFTWRFWAVALMGIMVPIGFFLVRNKPEDMGLRPDGEIDEEELIPDKLLTQNVSIGEKQWTLSEAMNTHAFWFMTFCMMVPAMVNTGLTFHIVSIFESKGLSSSTAAYVLSLIAIVNLGVNFVAGYIIDKIKVHYVKGMNFIVYIIMLIVLVYGKSLEVMIVFGVINGIFGAFDRISNEVLWPNYFGVENLGSIRGFAMTAVVIGAALGPLPFGMAFDFFHSYVQILFIMMIFPLLGSIFAFLSPPPIWKE